MSRETDYKDDKDFKKPVCSCCGNEFTRQQDKFFKNNYSEIYKSNNGFLTVCKECVLKRYDKYKIEFDSAEEAMRLICQNFDMYFNKDMFESSKKLGKGYCSSYFARANLMQGKDKTYVDTIKEESNNRVTSLVNAEDQNVDEESVKFWGANYSPEEYQQLNDEYSSWVINSNNGETPSKSLDTAFKQACQLIIDLQRARKNGKATEIASLSKSYLDCLSSAGLKPIQEDNSSLAENNSLGSLIEKWEETDPIPEPSKEFQDVDGIKHYIDVWFKGHLARMYGLQNDSTNDYEVEIAKYKVKPPEDGD